MHQSLGDASLRSYALDDAPLLARYANDAAITTFMHGAEPQRYSAADACAWIDFVRAQQPERQFAIDRDGELIGGIALELQVDIYAHSAELSYWVAESCWRRGIATRAVAAATDHGFAVLGLMRVYARVFDGNAASLRVLEKNAFEFEGRLRQAALKNGRACDQLLFAKLRGAG